MTSPAIRSPGAWRHGAGTRTAPRGTGALHMRGRPSTMVHRTVPRLETRWVLFPPLSDAHVRRGETLDPAFLERLDERWRAERLTGAAWVQPVGPHHLDIDLGRDPDVLVCEDESLTANVRLRLRGRLLLLDMPLLDRSEVLVGEARGIRGAERRIAAAGLLCGDIRLYARVRDGKHRRLGAPPKQLSLLGKRRDAAPGTDSEDRAALDPRRPRVSRHPVDPDEPQPPVCGGVW
jgi:hypothetical protein